MIRKEEFKYSSTADPIAWIKYSSTDEPKKTRFYAILCDMGDTLKLLSSSEEESSK
jgi:hypothetical protein